MKSRSRMKQSFLRIFAGAAFFAVLLPVTNAFALTGTCAMLVTLPVPYGASTPATDATYNILAAINFTNNTISYNVVKANYTTDGNGNHFSSHDVHNGVAFTTAAGPIAGSQAISFQDVVSNDTVTINIFPVNGNNTVLLQGATDVFGGVCQF